MSILAKVVSFSTGTGAIGTTIPVTGVGFTPKAIIFWTFGRTDLVDAVGLANLVCSFGGAVSPVKRFCVGGQVENGVATSNADQMHREDACVAELNTAAAFVGLLDLDSLDADGFTMIVDAVFSASRRVQALCLGGSSLTNANWVQFSSPAAIGTQDVTGYGFQPDFVLFASSQFANVPPSSDVDYRLCLGAAVSSTARWAVTSVSQNAVATMNANSMATSGLCILGLFPAGTLQSRADFVSFLADGFRVDWLQVPGVSRRWWGLALKGGNYRVDSLLSRTDGLDIVETGFGFRPAAALFVSHTKAEDAAAGPSTPNGVHSIGAFDSVASRGAQGYLDEDAIADSEVTTAIETDEVYLNISTGSVIEGLMDIKSVEADGFTCVMDDPDPVAAFIPYVAFGPAEGDFVSRKPWTDRAAIPAQGGVRA